MRPIHLYVDCPTTDFTSAGSRPFHGFGLLNLRSLSLKDAGHNNCLPTTVALPNTLTKLHVGPNYEAYYPPSAVWSHWPSYNLRSAFPTLIEFSLTCTVFKNAELVILLQSATQLRRLTITNLWLHKARGWKAVFDTIRGELHTGRRPKPYHFYSHAVAQIWTEISSSTSKPSTPALSKRRHPVTADSRILHSLLTLRRYSYRLWGGQEPPLELKRDRSPTDLQLIAYLEGSGKWTLELYEIWEVPPMNVYDVYDYDDIS